MYITQRTIKRLLKIEKNDSYDDLWRGNKELQDLLFLLTFLIPIIVAIDFRSIDPGTLAKGKAEYNNVSAYYHNYGTAGAATMIEFPT